MLLEIIAETVEDAKEAEQGGAGRIELVRDLSRGGLTPEPAVVEAVLKAVRIPVRVMVRESDVFEGTDPAELRQVSVAARHAVDAGAGGLVLGFLRNGLPDLEAVGKVLGALTTPVTFHRAFDEVVEPREAFAVLAGDVRVDRILTAGGAGAWAARLVRLQQLCQAAPPGLTILPGGGLDADGLRDLAEYGFREAHVGRAARIPAVDSGRVVARRVADLVSIATQFTRKRPVIDG